MIPEAQFSDAARSRSNSASSRAKQHATRAGYGQQVAVPGGLDSVGGQRAVGAVVDANCSRSVRSVIARREH
jgi:hypothetical protein